MSEKKYNSVFGKFGSCVKGGGREKQCYQKGSRKEAKISENTLGPNFGALFKFGQKQVLEKLIIVTQNKVAKVFKK